MNEQRKASTTTFYSTKISDKDAKRIEAESKRVNDLAKTITNTFVRERLEREAKSILVSAIYLQRDIDADEKELANVEELEKKAKLLQDKLARAKARKSELANVAK